MRMQIMTGFLTTRQAAALLGCSEDTAMRVLRRAQIEHATIGKMHAWPERMVKQLAVKRRLDAVKVK